MHKIAIDIHVKFFVWHKFSFHLGKCLEVELLGQVDRSHTYYKEDTVNSPAHAIVPIFAGCY